MIRPLSETKTLTAEGALNRKPRNQKIVATMTPHSQHGETRRQHYHATILGGRQSSARATDQLNPDATISLERGNRPAGRFGSRAITGPGLAN